MKRDSSDGRALGAGYLKAVPNLDLPLPARRTLTDLTSQKPVRDLPQPSLAYLLLPIFANMVRNPASSPKSTRPTYSASPDAPYRAGSIRNHTYSNYSIIPYRLPHGRKSAHDAKYGCYAYAETAFYNG